MAQETADENATDAALRHAFFGWQCRLRQIAMRQHEGRPQQGMVPTPEIDGRLNPAIITLMVRTQEHSELPQIKHIIRRTQDPEKRQKDALKMFSERYYQNPGDFEDTLCAVFQPNSAYAQQLASASGLSLDFFAYQQRFRLGVTAEILSSNDRLFQETYWHNYLFNPALPSDCLVLAFRPAWNKSAQISSEN